jgi:hypothetical protein
MKIEITENKVFAAGKDGKDQPVPKGTILEVKDFPGHLFGKARIVEEDPAPGLTTGEDLEALRAEYEKVTGNKAQPNMKPETMRAKIEEALKK